MGHKSEQTEGCLLADPGSLQLSAEKETGSLGGLDPKLPSQFLAPIFITLPSEEVTPIAKRESGTNHPY